MLWLCFPEPTDDDIPEWEKELQQELQVGVYRIIFMRDMVFSKDHFVIHNLIPLFCSKKVDIFILLESVRKMFLANSFARQNNHKFKKNKNIKKK